MRVAQAAAGAALLLVAIAGCSSERTPTPESVGLRVAELAGATHAELPVGWRTGQELTASSCPMPGDENRETGLYWSITLSIDDAREMLPTERVAAIETAWEQRGLTVVSDTGEQNGEAYANLDGTTEGSAYPGGLEATMSSLPGSGYVTIKSACVTGDASQYGFDSEQPASVAESTGLRVAELASASHAVMESGWTTIHVLTVFECTLPNDEPGVSWHTELRLDNAGELMPADRVAALTDAWELRGLSVEYEEYTEGNEGTEWSLLEGAAEAVTDEALPYQAGVTATMSSLPLLSLITINSECVAGDAKDFVYDR